MSDLTLALTIQNVRQSEEVAAQVSLQGDAAASVQEVRHKGKRTVFRRDRRHLRTDNSPPNITIPLPPPAESAVVEPTQSTGFSTPDIVISVSTQADTHTPKDSPSISVYQPIALVKEVLTQREWTPKTRGDFGFASTDIGQICPRRLPKDAMLARCVNLPTTTTIQHITDRQFLSVAAWSTSEDILQNKAFSKLGHGVLGVAIRSARIPGFENYVQNLHPSQQPHDEFLREYWEKEFGCTPLPSFSSLLPPCNGTESLFGVHSPFTEVSQLRMTYNVYLGVYAAAHAIHSLLSCSGTEASPASNCSSPQNVTSAELMQHLNKVTISTPHGETFAFQNGDFPPKFDLVNWQITSEGQLRNVLIGYVDEYGIHLNESVIQWGTGSAQVPVSVCTVSCEPGTRKAIRKGEPVCCFDCIPCGEGEVSNKTDSLQCDRCPLEFWSNPARTSCIPRQLDFLSFNETLGITLTTVAVSGAVVTTAVFVVFLYYRQTPMVRANNKELSFLLLVSLKLCFLCSLVFIGRPSVWSCRFQQAAFGISFVLSVSCLLVKTMVVLVAFRSSRPGSETLMKWFGPHQQRGSVGFFTTIQVRFSPPEPHVDLEVQGSKVTLECAMKSVLGFSLVLGYIGLLACTCLLLAFLARKLPDNFNEAKLITFSMLIFCAVWVAFVPAYVSSPGKYVVAVEIFAILASTYVCWLWSLWLWAAPVLLLLGLVQLLAVQSLVCTRWKSVSNQGLYQDGDVIIGGLYSLHYLPPNIDSDFTQPLLFKPCSGIEDLPMQYIYAMMFAVDEINHSESLLPGVKLGYRILDSCALHPWAMDAALSLVGGDSTFCAFTPENSTGFVREISQTSRIKTVPLIIGGASSKTAIILTGVLGPLSVPLMSYQSSCPCLSDKRQYPNFFRTIPSDIYQARALAQLAIHFQWTWIGAVVADNDYGLVAVKVFQEEIEKSGLCMAFVRTLRRENIVIDAREAALTIQASTAKVILVVSWYTDVRELFVQLNKINVTDKQFLASEAWSTSGDLLQHPATLKVAHGVFGVAIRSSNIDGFENYIKSLHPSQHPDNEYLREYWEKVFSCTPLSSSSSLLPPCNGTESLFTVNSHFTDMSQLRVTYNVYLAVYAAAHAIHSLLSCPDTEASPMSNCSSPQNITPAELLEHLSSVNFTTPQGERFYFNGGDIPAKYDLINWQKTAEGSLRLVRIGRVDGFDIDLNETTIQWSTGSSQVPVSVCTVSCEPGTRKAIRKGEPVCCFDCIPCGEGEVSNKTDSLQCDRCPLEFWSNPARTSCIPRQLDFLSFNETLGITLTTVAVSGAVVTTAVFVVFLYYRQTPMVRANNSELSFLLLVSLKLCFLCSLVFIGRPSVWSCRFQQAAFGISFVLSVSCLQVKTMVVLAAFRSARPGSESLMKWFGPNQQRGSVGIFTSVQILICIIWLSLNPPLPQPDWEMSGVKVTLECAMESVLGFSLVLGYIGLLACTCLLLAFLARKLPDNFNEAKLITFSMLIFCAVWVAFVPAYVSSPGKYSVAVEIFAILASSYGLLFCIFAPNALLYF
ncbi:hypothetical protein WMY93_017809 [Mugilogobius chulae]|uniref:G-protein coupled receptors family 3 profile domain-containing protein n=1 Tax=Mugilogobius chulae TaxID=88201 RepID=A0AAW0NZN1_9GOBI